MKRIRFIPAQVKTVPDGRPDACLHCGGGILNKRRTRSQARQRPLYKDRRRPQMNPPELRKDIPALSARNRPKRTKPKDARMGPALMRALCMSSRSAGGMLSAVGADETHAR